MPPNTPGIETRSIPLDAAQPTLTERGIEGYLAVFNQRTAIGDPKTWGFYEQIAPGAFAKTIAEEDQRSLFNHDANYPLARRSVGTLQLSEDDHGLRFSIAELPDTTYANDLRENIRNGNIAGSSFQFSAAPTGQSWQTQEDGTEVRTLTEVSVLEGGPVTFPAYESTEVSLRDAVSAAKVGRSQRATSTDPDDDPNSMIAAVDACIDEAMDLHAQGQDDQAWALITAADSTIDEVLDALGIPDADDAEEPATEANSARPAPESTASGAPRHGEAPTQRDKRRTAFNQRQLRAKALAALHHLET